MGMLGHYTAVDNEIIRRLTEGQELLEDLEIELENEDQLDIDKSWQGIHYLLCGSIDDGAPPLGYVVPMLDEQNIEFEPFGAFYLHPAQVAEASQAISGLTEERAKELYAFDKMVEDAVYPIVEGEDGAAFFDYIWTYLREIKQFYTQASAEGKGLIFYIM